MTLVQLRHLLSIAETGSFSRSAEKLHLTQPALSRSIRALEDELGRPLLDRVGRRNELTPFGVEMARRARAIVDDADVMVDAGRRLADGTGGRLRVGLGSGPGAMLMTPLLLEAAIAQGGLRLEIARGGLHLQVQALRDRLLDAAVLDARSLVPAPDLRVETPHEMRGAFLCRRGHPLARRRSVAFADLARFPIASTPLSDEVARILTERYGPSAHPDACVRLRCEEVGSLVETARRSDVVVLAIRAAAPDLVELPMNPPLRATARFAIVTLAGRSEAPALRILRRLVEDLLHDG